MLCWFIHKPLICLLRVAKHKFLVYQFFFSRMRFKVLIFMSSYCIISAYEHQDQLIVVELLSRYSSGSGGIALMHFVFWEVFFIIWKFRQTHWLDNLYHNERVGTTFHHLHQGSLNLFYYSRYPGINDQDNLQLDQDWPRLTKIDRTCTLAILNRRSCHRR